MDSIIDINLLRALATLLLFVAFVAICVAVFSRKRKAYYEDAAMLPFGEVGASRRQIDARRDSPELTADSEGNLASGREDGSATNAKDERA